MMKKNHFEFIHDPETDGELNIYKITTATIL